jgi:transcriptional regulator with PAS, ATPase and Fis domain
MSKLAPNWQKTSVFEAVFDQLSDALVMYDPQFQIAGVNRSAETLFGKSADQMVGKNCQEVFRSMVGRPGCGALLGLDTACPSAQQTLCLDIGNGVERLVVMRTSQVFDEGGRLAGGAAAIRDITEKSSPPHRHTVIAESPVMVGILKLVRRIGASEAGTVLLDGESGTGKDLIAKTLHYQSLRQAGPFIAVNCAAIPATLLESELFGYEKGAFTDARAQKRGIFELADRGTLFLDEIGEIPLILQAKLLRVLEDQTFRRLGGLADIQLDLRVVAATNKNLREAVKQKAFRQDLYFRLNVIQITIPPLRDRIEDIPPLAKLFIEHYNRKFKHNIQGLSGFATQLLLSYDWPGNVRELRNAIERGMILEESTRITSSSLPNAISRPAGQVRFTALHESERILVGRALEQTSGNQTQAARLLRLTRDQLRYKRRKLSLP